MPESPNAARPGIVGDLSAAVWQFLADGYLIFHRGAPGSGAPKGNQNARRFRGYANRGNGWQIDRLVQKTETFSGIDGVNNQDRAVQEAMGPIVDRSHEHLSHTDMAVLAARLLLLDAVRTVDDGGNPPGADTSYYHLRAIERVLPADAPWLEALKGEMYPAGAPI